MKAVGDKVGSTEAKEAIQRFEMTKVFSLDGLLLLPEHCAELTPDDIREKSTVALEELYRALSVRTFLLQSFPFSFQFFV